MTQHLYSQRNKATPREIAPGRPPTLSHLPPAVRSGAQGSGQALDKNTQAEMSARFGHDFSRVRVHVDAHADEAAEAVGAKAFTLGEDIVFSGGRYAPGSADGERLLAHELTHVVQQAQWGIPSFAQDSLSLSRRGDNAEMEARTTAEQVIAGRSVTVRAMPSATISRDDNDGPPDTPSVREKEKPGGPNDWGDKGFSFKWDGSGLLPKSADVDPGMGDPLTIPNPFGPKPPAPLAPAPSPDFMPKPGPELGPPLPLRDPLAPIGPQTPPAPGGLLGQPWASPWDKPFWGTGDEKPNVEF